MKNRIQIPGFELIEKVGQGGMAVVWKARQVSLDRVVAIKFLNTQAACRTEDQQRLLAEAHAAAHLKHPGIVQVYDAGIAEGVSYFVMEFIAGYSVGEWLRRKKVLPGEEALVVSECVAQALNYAWKTAGIIHCDVKPDNIMVDMDGTIKVADLGLARTIGTVSTVTNEKIEIMGTPGYISPEQSGGLTDLDCRADIYSLGATLYHLTTGKRLFERHGDTEAMDLQVTGHEKDPLTLRRGLPLEICWLIEKMLVKDRQHRYPDWDAVLLDVQRVKSGNLPSRPLPPIGASTVVRSDTRARLTREWENQRRTERRRRAWARRVPVLATVAALAVVTLILWFNARSKIRSYASIAHPPPAAATNELSPRIPPDEVEPVEESNPARDLFRFVTDWIEQNPGDYAEAIRRLSHVVDGAAGTKYSLMAEDMIAEMRAGRDAEIEAAWQSVSAALETMISAQRYREAAEYARAYEGPWHEEIRPRLRPLADDYVQRAEIYEAAQREAEQAAEMRFDAMMDELADIFLEQNATAALEFIEKCARDPVVEIRHNDLRVIGNLLREATGLDREVLRSFIPQAGKEIEIEFKDGPRTFFVRTVRDGRLWLEQRLEGDARVGYEFGVNDLAAGEYLARIENVDRYEVALMSGWHAYHKKDFDGAAAYFERTHPMLALVLSERARQKTQDRAEEQPQQELQRILRASGIEIQTDDRAAMLRALRGHDFQQAPLALRDRVVRFRENCQDTDFLPHVDAVLAELNAVMERQTARAAEVPPEAAKAVAMVAINEKDLSAVVDMLLNRNPGLVSNHVRVLREREMAYGIEIHSQFLKDIGALSTLRSLRALDLREGEISDLAPLAGLNQLQDLYIDGCAARDFQPLARLALRKLGLPGSSFSDTGMLRRMPLQELDLNRTAVRDIEGLRGLPLRSLELENTRILSLRAVSGMALERVNVAGTQVKDLALLRGMPLRELNLARTGVFDFSFMRGMQLTSLNLAETQFRDLALLEGMPLQHLDLSGTRASDVSLLRDMPLRHLELRNTPVRDLTPLQGAVLHTLFIDQCSNIRSLDFAAAMPLQRLGISDTGISDLTPLQSSELTLLLMENTAISDLAPLAGMPLRTLHLRGSPVRGYGLLTRLPIRNLTIDMRSEAARQVVWRIPTLRQVNGNRWPPPERR